jgi:DNA repair protein RadC
VRDVYAQLELHIIKEEYWSMQPRTAVELLDDWGLSRSPQETGYIVAFDGMRNVRTVVEVARGTSGTLDIHIPSVLRAVLLCGGERFAFIHTHPTGNAMPSPADTTTTEVLARSAAQIGLVLEDHIIVTPKRDVYFSFAEQGLYIPPAEQEGFPVTVDKKGKIIGYTPAAARTPT